MNAPIDKNFNWDEFVTSSQTNVHLNIECKNFDEINEDLKKYISNYMSFLLTNDPSSANYDKSIARYDNFVPDLLTFIKENPKLQKFLKNLGLNLRDAYFSLAWETCVFEHDIEQRDVVTPPHIDCPPVIWKINWPVMNMNNSSLRFFELVDPDISLNTIMTGPRKCKVPFEHIRPIKELDYDPKRCFFQNGSTIHDAVLTGPIEFPRIGLFLMFFNEPNIPIINESQN